MTAKRESEITRLLCDANTRTAHLRDAKDPRHKDGNHKRFALLGEAWALVQRKPRKEDEDRIFP
ncbi:hypothetical protein [uncultured Xanthomonas sp.]|uniref:hypothetical protein n=1 Tax=uncultured Xanthomonas sp. TaxID=152831 RepID=UPI0025F768D1|nr:hypothetical protein [uncultured Xanthomonas sp.]